jgi:hypothetical protein
MTFQKSLLLSGATRVIARETICVICVHSAAAVLPLPVLAGLKWLDLRAVFPYRFGHD